MPTQRRSTLDALSAEQQAFLRRETSPAGIVESCPPKQHSAAHSGAASRAGGNDHKRSRPMRGEPLRSVTLRLDPQVADALRRASSQRAIEYQEPYTQQAIADAALRDWLCRAGYFAS